MADQFEDAARIEELYTDIARKVRKPTLIACGACWNCETVLMDGRLFCDATCREDYEMIEAARIRNEGRK